MNTKKTARVNPQTPQKILEENAEKVKKKVDDTYREKGKALFKKGNPGRPIGIRMKKYALLDVIGAERGSEIVVKFLKKIDEGDKDFLLFAMDRMFSKQQHRHMVKVDLSRYNLNDMQGVSDACSFIIKEASEGNISLEDATKMVNLINWKQSINVTKLENDVINYIESKKQNKEGVIDGDELISEAEYRSRVQKNKMIPGN